MTIDSHNIEQFARHVAEQPSCPRWPSPACHDCGNICLAIPDIKWCNPSRRSWRAIAKTGKHGNLSTEQLAALLVVARHTKAGWSQAERAAHNRIMEGRS